MNPHPQALVLLLCVIALAGCVERVTPSEDASQATTPTEAPQDIDEAVSYTHLTLPTIYAV